MSEEQEEKRRLRLLRRAALRRCYDKRDPDYHRYGGRAIAMCDEWRDNPSAFVDWALDNGARRGLYLDRVDFDGPYSPENCRWVTPSESSRNRRVNITLTHGRETHCLAVWAERYEIPYEAFRARFHRGDRPPRLFRPVGT